MTHFAYPNVIPKQGLFIGCGRYRTLSPNETIDDKYQEIRETPQTPNRRHLEFALQLLSPESYDSDRMIIEKKDQPHYTYQGNSLDLAYFLAHTHRSKPLQQQIVGDIWCTGAIEVKDGIPILRKVDESGFQIKLAQFLKEEKHGNLFIVPAVNMQKENLDIAEASGANVISIHQLTDNLVSFKPNIKTLLKVLPNELPILINWLFQSQSSRKSLKVGFAVGLLIMLSILVGLWYYHKSSYPGFNEIENLLNEGQLFTAKQLSEQFKGDSSEISALWALINSSHNIKAAIEVRKKGSTASESFSMDDNNARELILTHEDDYRLIISADDPSEKLYLYIYQIDESNHAYNIFPNVKWNFENPIVANQWPVSVPSGDENWLYLDQLSSTWGSVMKETLHVFVSPWRARDIESTFDAITNETDRTERERLIKNLKDQINSRKKANIPSVTCYTFSFSHR